MKAFQSANRGKYLQFGCLILLFLIALSVFVSCSPSIVDMEYPDEKTLAKIESQYQSKTNDELYIDRCFGVYNGSVPIMFAGGFWPTMGVTLEIEGFRFSFPTPNVMQVWNNGNFFALDVAYNRGMLTYKDIADIYEQYQDYLKSK